MTISYYMDRVWDWGCGQVTKNPLRDCSWSSDPNRWTQDLTFRFPRNKSITYRCEELSYEQTRGQTLGEVGSKVNRLIDSCLMTNHVNMLHGDLDHQVGSQCGGSQGVMVGLESRWKQYDRRWRMVECSLVREEPRI